MFRIEYATYQGQWRLEKKFPLRQAAAAAKYLADLQNSDHLVSYRIVFEIQ